MTNYHETHGLGEHSYKILADMPKSAQICPNIWDMFGKSPYWASVVRVLGQRAQLRGK